VCPLPVSVALDEPNSKMKLQIEKDFKGGSSCEGKSVK
jgi:hypothetical protein